MEAKRLEGKGEGLPRVLALDGVAAAGIEVLKSVADVEVRKTISQEELHQILPEFDALIVRSATTVTESLIKRGFKLKVIGRAGVGVDNICLDAATARGIYVVNSPQGNTIAAAELALGFMFALSRRMCLADESVARSEWERSRFQGAQLHGKTLGVVGLGQVGSYIARVCSFMDMEVLAYDPFINEAKAKALGVSTVSFEHLLAHSDVITLHVPLIESTQRLIRDETLKLMKPHALLINTSRGIVLAAPAAAAAAAATVVVVVAVLQGAWWMRQQLLLRCERDDWEELLWMWASTQEAQINVSLDVAQQVKHVLLGELPKSAVNLPVSMPSSSSRRSSSSKTSSSSSSSKSSNSSSSSRLCSQLLHTPVETLTLKVSGHIEDGELDVLLLAVESHACCFMNGLLATRCEHRVNFVNVRKLASEHKIELSAAKGCPVCPSLPACLLPHTNKQYVRVATTATAAAAAAVGLSLLQHTGLPRSLPQYQLVRTRRACCSCGSSSLCPSPSACRASTPCLLLLLRQCLPNPAPVQQQGKAQGRPTSALDAINTQPQEASNPSTSSTQSTCPPPTAAAAAVAVAATAAVADAAAADLAAAAAVTDKPGVLAAILALVSSAQINVANCHLGRRCRDEIPAAAAPKAKAAAAGDEQSPRLSKQQQQQQQQQEQQQQQQQQQQEQQQQRLLLLLLQQGRNRDTRHSSAGALAALRQQQEQQQQQQQQLVLFVITGLWAGRSFAAEGRQQETVKLL
ncbi:hypothetical protein Emed_004375 [Eimeria media]